MTTASPLPILEVETQLTVHLHQANRLVLSAPTGSGKTTQVPQLIARSGAVDGQILVLQPRRLAARWVASRVAEELGTELGEEVGYQTRFERRIGSRTRIRFLTEGIFLRLIQNEPALRGVGAVVLDEFHERSLALDLALALTRRLQQTRRPELRLMVMSATLETRAVAGYLGCPVVEAHGRAHPVETRYLPRPAQEPVWDQAARALRLLLDGGTEGEVLVFMPGAYEIRRTIQSCQQLRWNEELLFLPLHGTLPPDQQDLALRPADRRKVIVATNVAETSITIPGVRHVIDSGLARVHRHDPRRGINVLMVEGISRASADQRQGRAGRTSPGTCTRLWSEAEHHARPSHSTPEIQRVDLAEPLLQLKEMGLEFGGLEWLEPPQDLALARAHRLLRGFGALDAEQQLTPLGRQLAAFPMHPRLSRLLVEAHRRQCLGRALVWAALLGERDILTQPLRPQYTQSDEAYPSDLEVRERGFEKAKQARFEAQRCAELGLNAQAGREVDQVCRQYRDLCRKAGLSSETRGQTEELSKCLIAAFYDQVALHRDPDSLNCALAGQRRVELDRQSVARPARMLVAAEVREVETGGGVRTVLSLASAIEPGWLEEVEEGRVEVRVETVWNSEMRAVEQRERRSFEGLVYEERVLPKSDPAAAAEILVERIEAGELVLERWDQGVEQWLARARSVAAWFPERELLAYTLEELRVILHEIVSGATRYSQIRERACLPAVQGALSWQEQQFVEQMAPTRLQLSNGHCLKLEYQADAPPRGRAKIQELYDVRESPTVAGGRQRVLLEILGPHFRPLQVTDDLASFWQNTYPELKKELRRRYPKHEWR
ncbi:MAG: ATP-dependent helicase HrpB [Candidatus Handelsmanbacteria bacterium]|nr:ATP-dependent helicase HrpB [Candidatus Handelsmanbacteria bacterium]